MYVIHGFNCWLFKFYYTFQGEKSAVNSEYFSTFGQSST